VSLYTKQPTFKTEGSTEVSYGEHNLVEVKGMFNTPLIDDRLAARVVLSGATVDGNIRDITTGADLNGEHRWAARAKLLFTPRDDLKFVAGFDFLQKQGSDSTWISGNFQPSQVPGLSFNPEQTNQLTPGVDRQRNWGFTGRADWTTGIGTFTSITGYRHLDSYNLTVSEPAPVNLSSIAAREHDTQTTEEIRLASPADRKLTWVAGVYYLHNNKSREIAGVFNYLSQTLFGSFAGFPSPIDYLVLQSTGTTSAAPFADVTYSLTDQLKVDVGGRYTWQRKTGQGYLNPAFAIAGPPIGAGQAASWTAFTPKLTVSYEATKGLMTYATASRGFLSGGFNAQGSTDLALATPFDSEYVCNYELGAKFNGLDDRIQVNVAGFVDRYSNLQIIELVPASGTVFTANAGAAEVDGVETDISGAPAAWLTVGVKYDYLHSKFTRYVSANGDYTGNKVPFTPSHRVTASAEVHTELSNGAGSVALGGDYTYRSSQEFTAANDTPPDIRNLTPWRGIINLHAFWYAPNDRLEVSVWGKNISNRHYAVFGQDQTFAYETPNEANANPQAHIFELQAGPYRSFGLTLTAKF
jgi:iron complex outermembrane receptor protein